MSNVHPEILRMRAARVALTLSLTEPLQRKVAALQSKRVELQKAVDTLTAILRSELHDHLQRETARSITDKVVSKIREQMAAPLDAAGYITLRLNCFDLTLLDPDSLSRKALDAWLRVRGREASLRATDAGSLSECGPFHSLAVTFPTLAVTFSIPDYQHSKECPSNARSQ